MLRSEFGTCCLFRAWAEGVGVQRIQVPCHFDRERQRRSRRRDGLSASEPAASGCPNSSEGPPHLVVVRCMFGSVRSSPFLRRPRPPQSTGSTDAPWLRAPRRLRWALRVPQPFWLPRALWLPARHSSGAAAAVVWTAPVLLPPVQHHGVCPPPRPRLLWQWQVRDLVSDMHSVLWCCLVSGGQLGRLTLSETHGRPSSSRFGHPTFDMVLM